VVNTFNINGFLQESNLDTVRLVRTYHYLCIYARFMKHHII